MIRQKKSGSGHQVQQSSRSTSASSSSTVTATAKPESPSASRRRSNESGSSRHSAGADRDGDRTNRPLNEVPLHRQLCSPSLPSASSDEDIDPELREGIHNIMKLRDEYDKLEGALRQLGVDGGGASVRPPHRQFGQHQFVDEDDDDEDQLFGEEYSDYNEEIVEVNRRPLNPVPPPLTLLDLTTADFSAISADPFGSSCDGRSEPMTSAFNSAEDNLQPMTTRLRHLEILEEVDESVLSSEAGEDPPLPPPPPPSYPWIQMALPGGGIVTVPLKTDSAAAAASGSSFHPLPVDSSSLGGASGLGLHHHLRLHSLHSNLAQPGGGGGAALPPPGSLSDAVLPTSAAGGDLLTVPAGEPVTHFNLDQLLEIVQSFQLDTTMAGHEPGSNPLDLGALMQNPNAEGTHSMTGGVGDLSGCDINTKHCDTTTTTTTTKRSGEASATATGRASLEGGVALLGLTQPQPSSSASHREIHSCPSSPTETECSSGFSTLRRRSVTLTEKIRTSKDGSKTQVVRQYGCNTSSAGEPNQTMTFQQKSFVYINGAKVAASHLDECGQLRDEDGDDLGGATSQSFPSLIPISSASQHVSSAMPSSSNPLYQSGRSGLGSHPSHHGSNRPYCATTLPRSGAETSSHRTSHTTPRGQHFVRLNSIEPNTVMFSTKDYPILNDVTVPEIIDELEKQFSERLCDLQGVRLVANNVYICLSRRESLQHLSTYGFYVRGVPVRLVDITHDSVVLCLSGVPHYITDATVTMLVSTFGIAIGEVERRFYKGVDTGERYVRLKPRSHTQVPDQITVGGCKIFISVLSNEEVCSPYILQSTTSDPPQPYSMGGGGGDMYATTTTTMAGAHYTGGSMAGSGSDRGTGLPGNFRAKPGHCNGTVNSPGEAPGCSSSLMLSSSFGGVSRCEASSSSSLPASPKIGKSFRSRINLGMRSPTHQHQAVDEVDRTYVPGEQLDDFPSLSPPPYKTPSSAGSSSTTSNGGGGRHVSAASILANTGRMSLDLDKKMTSSSSNMRNKYRQSNKTDSSTSLASQPGAGGGGPTAASKMMSSHGNGGHNHGNGGHGHGGGHGIGGGHGNGPDLIHGKRASVVFEEPRAPTLTTMTTSHSSSSTAPTQGGPTSSSLSRAAAMATSKTVNGILRKGSVPGDDIVPTSTGTITSQPMQQTQQMNKDVEKQRTPPSGLRLSGLGGKNNNNEKEKESKESKSLAEKKLANEDAEKTADGDKVKDRKSRKNKEKHSSTKSGRSRSSKLDSLPESGPDDGESTLPRSSRSRSSSSKSSSKADKSAKDLALTRDLPWCGCWGNGCL